MLRCPESEPLFRDFDILWITFNAYHLFPRI